MSSRIDDRIGASDITPRAIAALLIVAAVVVAFAVSVRSTTERSWFRPDIEAPWKYILHAPPIVAYDLALDDAIREFSGRRPEPIPLRTQSFLLASILLMGVVGPTLMFLAVRRAAVEPPAPVLRAGTAVGVLMGGMWMGLSLPGAIVFHVNQPVVREQQSIQRTRDQMINEVNAISIAAQVYYWKPRSAGGGDQSYAGWTAVLPDTFWGRYTISVGRTRLQIDAVPRRDPRTLYGFTATGPIPDAGFAVTIDSLGNARPWVFRGLFK